MKKTIIILIVIIVVLIGVIGYLKLVDYKTGSIQEREELLIAVTDDLFNKKDISLDKIENIKVHRQEAGVYPFFYIAVVTLNNGETYTYKWSDKDKSKLDTIN